MNGTRSRSRSVVAVGLLLVATNCHAPSKTRPTHARDGGAATGAPLRPSPLSFKELPTTDSSIALGNLESDIRGGEADLAKNPRAGDRLSTLVEELTVRGQYLGRLADYFQALELADRLVTVEPMNPRSYLVRAGARGTFHRFDDALADLDKATALHGAADKIDEQRAALLQAKGRYGEALVIRQRLVERHRTISSLGNEATLLAAMGRTIDAERAFTDAQYVYNDVSPFPVAWLWFQQALMWEGAGRPGRARKLLEAALARLPPYAAAVSHLAALEPSLSAIERLGPLARTSDDPEYTAQLGVLLRENGKAEDGDALVMRAKAGYDGLLLREPAAFADHAARFFLGAGKDPKRALALARANALARPTPQALTLVKDAELAVRAASSRDQ
jgi:tetratricopeptide (TPR) repeat protein